MSIPRNRRQEIDDALSFIEAKWSYLRANARSGHPDEFRSWQALANTSVDGHLDDTDPADPYILYLPQDFITPGGRFMVQFYWDSYFIVLALLRAGHFELAKGMVENCLFLVNRHGMVIANRKRWAAGSQLPFLSQMVREVYHAGGDLEWLRTAMPTVEAEYSHYWLNDDHLAFEGLSRYHAPPCYPREHVPAITMDHECTWDLSPRFEVHDVLSLLPVDLNSNLYAYENDLAFFSHATGDLQGERIWLEKAERRKARINELLWEPSDGLYYDYNFKTGRRKPVKSLAAYFPLLQGIAGDEQSKALARNLPLFERDYGLVACDQAYGYTDRQWNYPVGWAPLHLTTYRALQRCGEQDSAVRVARKWLDN